MTQKNAGPLSDDFVESGLASFDDRIEPGGLGYGQCVYNAVELLSDLRSERR